MKERMFIDSEAQISEDSPGIQLFKALGGVWSPPVTVTISEAPRKAPKPYAGRVPVYVKLGTGPGVHVWMPPGRAAALAVGQRLHVYLGPERFSKPCGVLVDGVRETANGSMWLMQFH